jgi:hypothetical protein
MCVELFITFTNCECTVTQHYICYQHVEYTHRQVSNDPCPFYKFETQATSEQGCQNQGDIKKCTRKHETDYVFETEVEGKSATQLWKKVWGIEDSDEESSNEVQMKDQDIADQEMTDQKIAEHEIEGRVLVEHEINDEIQAEQETESQPKALVDKLEQEMSK